MELSFLQVSVVEWSTKTTDNMLFPYLSLFRVLLSYVCVSLPEPVCTSFLILSMIKLNPATTSPAMMMTWWSEFQSCSFVQHTVGCTVMMLIRLICEEKFKESCVCRIWIIDGSIEYVYRICSIIVNTVIFKKEENKLIQWLTISRNGHLIDMLNYEWFLEWIWMNLLNLSAGACGQ